MAIKPGDRVKVHYTGRLKDGTEFDTSRDREPLEFVVGTGMLISGFENAIMGREQGETINAEIDPAHGYGDVDEDLIFEVSRSQVPDNIPLEVGTPLQLTSDKGNMDVTITEVGPEDITLDANHPLAGKDMEFEIEIIEVKPAPAELKPMMSANPEKAKKA